MNNDILYSINYHEMTKHSEFSVMNSNYYLDWNNRPKPFKVYKDLVFFPSSSRFSSSHLECYFSS